LSSSSFVSAGGFLCFALRALCGNAQADTVAAGGTRTPHPTPHNTTTHRDRATHRHGHQGQHAVLRSAPGRAGRDH
jgi:hypothetical protein